MTLKEKLSDYTESEFLLLVKEICSAVGGEAYQDELLEHLMEVTSNPAASDWIYCPDPGADDFPEGITRTVKAWGAANGLPGFKSN
ncbi:bacteriocin immunity protein [Pseudomonas gingeri]|nr:bacteriocin immunity protein [Pseudomonas gingeri]